MTNDRMQESSSGETVVDLVLAERVLAAIDQEETVAFLQELVRCPTVNPPGDVRAAAAVCAAKLLGAGFAVEVVGPGPELLRFPRSPGSCRSRPSWG